MSAAVNPLVPAGYDVMWTVVLITALVLSVTALWQALRSPSHTGTQQLLWALIVLVAPVLGALAWFVLGRRARPAADARSDPRSVA